MTIAIALKVGDGIVLGADSAATVGSESGAANVYFTAEKIFNLVKGLPIGAVTYGLFGFGGRSTTRVAKDLRDRLSAATGEYHLDPSAYTIEEVAEKVRRYFFDELYTKEWGEEADKAGSGFGFIIAGYSAGAAHGEVWKMDVLESGECAGPTCVIGQDAIGAVWDGQTEALDRLVRGWSANLVMGLVDHGLPFEEAVAQVDDVAPLWHNAMPVQDAIDLVRFLVETTAGFFRFSPGYPTVALPADLAAITLHEGFRWVARKHYYPPDLNPSLPGRGP